MLPALREAYLSVFMATVAMARTDIGVSFEGTAERYYETHCSKFSFLFFFFFTIEDL